MGVEFKCALDESGVVLDELDKGLAISRGASIGEISLSVTTLNSLFVTSGVPENVQL